MFIVSLLLMAGIYLCTISALKDTKKLLGPQALDPVMPLSMILSTLLFMLLLSASVGALGSLFLARDLDLVLSAPIPRWQFLLGRGTDVAISSSWMLAMFGLPSLFAFGMFFDAHWYYFAFSPIICAVFLTIPVIGAILVALVFGAIVPPNRGREVFLILFVVSLGMMVVYLNSPQGPQGASPAAANVVAFMKFSRLSTSGFSPSYYCTMAMAELMRGQLRYSIWTLVSLIFAAALLGLLATKLCDVFYERAYTAAQSQRSTFKINSRSAQYMARALLPFVSPQSRALVTKEFKIFSRDISHTIQLGMLLAICFVYLYNFRTLRSPANVSPDVLRWWEAFLMICNAALSALVVTSICSRFVFPSVSLEGASFWLVQSAPISPYDVLRTKFRAWFVPLAVIGSVVFISGAMALNAEGPLVLATCVAGIILSYGLVALGIGMGAVFSQFDWEYSAQLSTNLGSFLYMFSALLLLAIDLIPLTMMFGGYLILTQTSEPEPVPTSTLVLICGLGTLFLINRVLGAWALKTGAKALTPK
jgi:ABC-2 type transport system permease protein